MIFFMKRSVQNVEITVLSLNFSVHLLNSLFQIDNFTYKYKF
jgi:hypothetical protein